MIRPLPKAGLKIVTSTSYPAVEPKKRSEEWKKASSAKIWRFDCRWKQKGWGMNTMVSMCRAVVSIHSSPAILFVCAYAACSLCYMGFQAVCDVLFYLWYQRAKMAQLLMRMPTWEAPELQTIDVPHAPLPFQSHLSYTFQHSHCSLINTQFFQPKTCIPLVKINIKPKNWAFSRAPQFRSQYDSTRLQSTNCLSLVDGWAQQMSLQRATAEMKVSESHL